MKISPKMLHIPPYISASWDTIRALFVREHLLIIQLNDGLLINVPNLDQGVIDAIFTAHAEFLETQNQQVQSRPKEQHPTHFFQGPSGEPMQTTSFQFAISNLDSLNSALQHNPAQSNMPALPDEILKKISAIAKIVAPEEIQNLPMPESNCNCMHCQIARAIHQQNESGQKSPSDTHEEVIADEELKFQDWEITSSGEKLYTVVSKLNREEKYLVYLGEPFGCTCGMQNCEHIIAVLRS